MYFELKFKDTGVEIFKDHELILFFSYELLEDRDLILFWFEKINSLKVLYEK